jgi:hypothetical protein
MDGQHLGQSLAEPVDPAGLMPGSRLKESQGKEGTFTLSLINQSWL